MARLVGITAGTTEGALPGDFQGQEWLISSKDLPPCRYDVCESHKQCLYPSGAWPRRTEFAGETRSAPLMQVYAREYQRWGRVRMVLQDLLSVRGWILCLDQRWIALLLPRRSLASAG